jgi:hypothetical protein
MLSLDAPVARVRRGHELRLVLTADTGPTAAAPARDEKLVALLAEAQKAMAVVLASPGQTLTAIAASDGRCRKRLARLIRVAWLAPDIVSAIVKGVAPAELTSAKLLDADLSASWAEQRILLDCA